MKLRFCVICGTNKNLQHHHIVPRSRGGDDHPWNLLTFCEEHHNFVHNVRKTCRKGDFGQLVKMGQRNSGNFGGRPKTPKQVELEVCKLRKEGKSFRQIKKITGVALATIQRILKDHGITCKEVLDNLKVE